MLVFTIGIAMLRSRFCCSVKKENIFQITLFFINLVIRMRSVDRSIVVIWLIYFAYLRYTDLRSKCSVFLKHFLTRNNYWSSHHHVLSVTALSHRTARPSIFAMSSLIGLSPKCRQFVLLWPRSHVAAPHMQVLLSR